MTGIYMIINKINNKIYIGQAVNISKRWSDHKSALNKGNHNNKHLQSAWDRYGEDSFEFTVLCECPEEQLNTIEEYFILCFDSHDRRVGYNQTYGGGGCKANAETRKKLSEAQNRPEVKKRKSETHKGKTLSAKTRKKLSETHKGKTRSEESKIKQSESTKNRKDLSKAVIGIHKVTGLIVEYPSCNEAERKTGTDNSCISLCCRGIRKSAGGYYWFYADSQEVAE